MIRENLIWVLLGVMVVFYVWIVATSRGRQARAEAYMAKAREDAEEYKRHNAAIEAKLDRIIGLMERGGGEG